MFVDKITAKFFKDVRGFQTLPASCFLINEGNGSNLGCYLPYKSTDGKVCRTLVKEYLDIFLDAGKDYCIKHPSQFETLLKIAEKTGIDKVAIKNREGLLHPLKISSQGYIGDYDTLVNLWMRLQLLLREDPLSKYNLTTLFREGYVSIQQGSALRAKFFIDRPHSFYWFALKTFVKNNGLTHRFFDFKTYA